MARENKRIDQFLLIHSARADNWREITTLAEAWAAKRGERAALEASLATIAPTEEYHAYPGARLLAALNERIATDDASGAAKLARRTPQDAPAGGYFHLRADLRRILRGCSLCGSGKS